MENNDIHLRPGYSYPAPYPEIKVLGKNQYYAEILMNDYAGMVSEITAINQYLYHYFVINKEYDELREMLENISINEMKHMEILAKLIILLGGIPTYSAQNTYWNGGFVYYGNSLCEQIEADLKAEYEAINNYKRDISIINDPYIQAILCRIILDEQVHVQLFINALNKYCKK
jgi:bacterioferritin